jgi:pimeloyl-ACP methyl ester carboxylesterase
VTRFGTEERAVAAGGDASLRAQAFGAEGDPAVLLIAGARASMLGWPDGFCDGLEDLAADAAAVLDAYGVERAHVAGMGLGGVVAPLDAGRRALPAGVEPAAASRGSRRRCS